METGTAPGKKAILLHASANTGFNEAGENLLLNAILCLVTIDMYGDGLPDTLDLYSDKDRCINANEA